MTDDLTTTERAIAWRAADYADPTGARVYPGSQRLAADCGLKVDPAATRNKVVERALARLVALGWAVKVSAGHRGHAAAYQLTIPVKGDSRVPLSDRKGDCRPPERGTPQSPHQPRTTQDLGSPPDWYPT